MNVQFGLDKCPPFLSTQARDATNAAAPPMAAEPAEPRRAITICRQTGCGARLVAGKLAEYLQARFPGGTPPWAVFDGNLTEKVLQEHNLPTRLARFMPEDNLSEWADMFDELLGAHPPTWTLVRNTAETILRLAEQGNVVLIGRGANIVTSRLEHVFHVRLVGSEPARVERVAAALGLSRRAALELIRREDRGRQRYLKQHYGRDVADPLLYHLVLNTDLVPCEKAAAFIVEAMLSGPGNGSRRAPAPYPAQMVSHEAASENIFGETLMRA